MIKNIKDVKNVVVFSGTSDSVDIIKMLSKKGFNVIASVATEEGAKMLSSVKNITVSEGRLDTDDMIKLFDKYNTDIVVDGSHPYAENVSKTAICACKIYNIPYVRYERPSSFGIENCVFVDDYESAVDYIENISGNILITTGVNNIEKYTKLNDFKNRIFVRVLDNKKSFEKAKNIGLDEFRILKGNGIYTFDDNVNVIKKYNIKAVVTKDSGKIGGVDDKIKAAQYFNIPVVVIKRPVIEYGNVFDNIFDVVKFIEEGE